MPSSKPLKLFGNDKKNVKQTTINFVATKCIKKEEMPTAQPIHRMDTDQVLKIKPAIKKPDPPRIHIIYDTKQNEKRIRELSESGKVIEASLSDTQINPSHGFTGDPDYMDEVAKSVMEDSIDEKAWIERIRNSVKKYAQSRESLVVYYLGSNHKVKKLKWFNKVLKGVNLFGTENPKWRPKHVYIIDEIGSPLIEAAAKYADQIEEEI